ncbi:MAG: ABC transporter ATP-binding protein [Patescibacteria group bacterium]|nr:ABC transporter ATP-binding protein [Patescibacteria group bacterium]
MRLRIRNIRKNFKTKNGSVCALDNINLDIQPGEFVCLVGPSGCGKSTLLNIMAGLEKQDSGRIKVDGKIGLMFQEPALFPWLKVKDNVGFGLKIKKLEKQKQEKFIDAHLKMVHLQNFAESYPHELSGGMKQRVALARTLILNPDILLMDEPFAALDAQTREILYKELQNIWQLTKKTVVFVTHNVREAVCLGDRVVVFSARPGRIKKIFDVDLSRPRDLGNLELIKMSNKIMDVLKSEIKEL